MTEQERNEIINELRHDWIELKDKNDEQSKTARRIIEDQLNELGGMKAY